MSINHFEKKINKLQKTKDGFNAIYLLEYLDSSMLHYIVNQYVKCGKVAPFVKDGRKTSLKSLYIDFDELLDIQDFLKECKENQKKYSSTLIKVLRKINFVVRMKG